MMLNFVEGNMCGNITPYNDREGIFEWCSFNGSGDEPLVIEWPESPLRKKYLNPTNYGTGAYFEFDLRSNSSVTQVYYYSGDAMVGNWS